MPKKQSYTTGWHRERKHGYSRAIRCGDLIFVSGTTGFDYERNTLADDPADQTRTAFANIDNALRQLGSSLKDVIQLTTYFTDRDDYPAIAAVLGDELSDIRPTNTAIMCDLAAPEMKVEVSAMAIIGAGED